MRSFVILALLALSGCASILVREVHPSKTNVIAACLVSCPYGYGFRPQHICKGTTRWMTDVALVGEYVVRGADGTKLIDTYVALDGSEYDKRDVELGSCRSFISRLIALRGAEKRGIEPGEDDHGQPLHP